MLLACLVVLALLVNVDEVFLNDDDDLEELLGWDDEDLEVEEWEEAGVALDDVEGALEDDASLREEDDLMGDDEDLGELKGDATDDSRLHALREAGTVATLSTVEGEREETFLVLEVFWEVVEAFVEIGLPFRLVDTFNVEEDFLLVEVVFVEEEDFLLLEVVFIEEEDFLLDEVAFELTVVFFVEEDALTVEVVLIVEVARLTWEEEAGWNMWAIRLSKFTRGCKESRERR